MRISSTVRENFPELTRFVHGLSKELQAGTVLEKFLALAAPQQEKARKALSSKTANPWIAVVPLEDGDTRAKFNDENRSTVLIGREFAEAFGAAADDPAVRLEMSVVLLRGLLHWLGDVPWVTRESEPGHAFELTVRNMLSDGAGSGADSLAPPVPKPVPPVADAALESIMGAAILDIAKRHIGQKYAHEPVPDYEHPNWKGVFDCAEYASYCAYRAYGTLYGVEKLNRTKYHSYTGFWRNFANRYGIRISWRDALEIPGAFLLRNPPGGGRMGHIAISLGNGGDIYEARGRKYGVVKHTALGRAWTTGILIPGVLYDVPGNGGGFPLLFKLLDPPLGHNPIVERIQQALIERDLLDEDEDHGIYDETTSAAIAAFQADKGLVEDGEVGPQTAKQLGLGAIWEVEDQPLPQVPASVEEEALTLARTLYGESRGETKKGQEAVANVILNRARSGRYPNSVSKVCLQPWQFSCWNHNDPNRKKIARLKPGSNETFDKLLAIAKRALAGKLADATGGALHYHATSIAIPKWVLKSPAARISARVGAHIFYTGIR